jgi:DNA-binding response OmpR family regulator
MAVIMLTAATSAANPARSRGRRANDYMSKPFRFDEVGARAPAVVGCAGAEAGTPAPGASSLTFKTRRIGGERTPVDLRPAVRPRRSSSATPTSVLSRSSCSAGYRP